MVSMGLSGMSAGLWVPQGGEAGRLGDTTCTAEGFLGAGLSVSADGARRKTRPLFASSCSAFVLPSDPWAMLPSLALGLGLPSRQGRSLRPITSELVERIHS